VEILDPVLCRGYPRAETLEELYKLADAIAERHGKL